MSTKFDSVEGPIRLEGELLEMAALTADGEFFNDDDPATWDAADAAEVETVSRGSVRFRIIDWDAEKMAIATGLVHADTPPRVLCLHVAFEETDGAPQPALGQFLVMKATESVSIKFLVAITKRDLDDQGAPDLGLDAVRNEAFDALEVGHGLLVQVLPDDGYQGDAAGAVAEVA